MDDNYHRQWVREQKEKEIAAKLKPCPFCGNKPHINENVVRIHCIPCMRKGLTVSVEVFKPIGPYDETLNKCIKEWNTRTPEGKDASLDSKN